MRAILKGLGRALILSAATASVIGLAAAPALAATTWTVTPGGAVTATAGKTVVSDATTGLSVTCSSSVAKGTLKKGSGLAGAGLGTVTSLAFNKCTVDSVSVSMSVTGKMPLNGVSYNASKKTASMTITKIHGTLAAKSLGCSGVVDGTGATKHNGMVTATYSNSKDTLTVSAKGGNLHLYDVKGCSGVINTGDAANFTGAYKFAPTTTITGS